MAQTSSFPSLREADADPDPLRQFAAWFGAASASGLSQPEAAALATATPDGAPSVRIVLVKQVDAEGFVFYTNYESRKSRELSANPRASLMYFWEPLGRAVRIEGSVHRTTRAESEAYAHSRERGSQLSALASPQSRTVADRAELEQRVAELAERYPDEVPLAEAWGGWRLGPERYEFWQAGLSRLHDRLVYSSPGGSDGGWKLTRLAP